MVISIFVAKVDDNVHLKKLKYNPIALSLQQT